MNKTLLGLLLVLGLMANAPFAAALGTVQITVKKTADKGEKPRGEEEGSEARLVDQVSYDITLVNGTFADLTGLTVDYLIFVEHQKLGKKKDEDVVVRVTGSETIPMLTNKAPQNVKTKIVKLTKANLVGYYYFPNGGRIKVADSIKGVWVRISQGGKIIGEYTNPSTVTARGWDAK